MSDEARLHEPDEIADLRVRLLEEKTRAESAEWQLREAERELEKAQRAGAALAGDSAGFFRDLAKAESEQRARAEAAETALREADEVLTEGWSDPFPEHCIPLALAVVRGNATVSTEREAR